MGFFRKIICLTFLFSALYLHAFAASGPVTLNVDIPSGKWKGVRLKNLPKGAVLAVRVESDGGIGMALVDAANVRFLPESRRTLFSGRVDRKLAFSVSIQNSGDHYLVFDNRGGTETRSVRVTVKAARGVEDQIASANKTLVAFESQLHKVFVFDPFPVGIRKCGNPKAFVESSGITLCAEYLFHLYDVLGDEDKAKHALSFSMFHEIGRTLLSLWDHPFAANIEVADEFASVLMVMLNQQGPAEKAARGVMEDPTAYVVLKGRLHDDRHPLSPQRAENVLDWIKDTEQARRWQKVLVPHMQTALLKKLKGHPASWADLSLIEEELAKREKKRI